MRRLMTLIALAASLLLVASAVPAAAAKGGNKPDNPGPPPPEGPPGVTCTWSETNGEHEYDDGTWGPNDPDGYLRTDDFTAKLTPGDPDLCLDILTTEAGQWHLTLSGEDDPETSEDDSGSLRAATIVPRDAFAPGDSCGGIIRRGRPVYDLWTFPLPDDPSTEEYDGDPRTWFPIVDGQKAIPAATVNACAGDDDNATAWPPGTDDTWGWFGEWFDWDEDGEVDFDPQYAENGELLYPSEEIMTFSNEPHPLVLLVFTQGLKGTVDVCVDLPPYDESDPSCPLEP